MTKTRDKRASIRIGRYAIPVPETRWKRLILAWCLTAAGMLPVVGWGFLPLGLLLLSVDSPAIRRGRRRVEVRWGRWQKDRKASQAIEGGNDPGPKRKGRV
jgi:hypothetical protein